MNHLMSPIFVDFNGNEVRGSNIPQDFMYGELVVWKEGKRRMICFSEYVNLVARIPRTDTDQFNFVQEVRHAAVWPQPSTRLRRCPMWGW